MSRQSYRFVFESDKGGQLVSGPQPLNFRLAVRPQPRLEPHLLSHDARDLLRIAIAAFSADKLAARAPKNAREAARDVRWQRTLDITLPVEDVDRWSRLSPKLEEILTFLTDDQWVFHFMHRRRGPAPTRPLFDDDLAKCDVALCSQGLDSALGIAAANQSDRPVVLASVYSNGLRTRAIRDVLEMLRSFRTAVRPVGILVQLSGAEMEEPSQRTRGFLFFAVGAVTANAIKSSSLVTYENGVGALNLPMSEAQVGAQNTRAMHPRTLLLIEDLFAHALDVPIRVRAPFLLETKGAMCRRLRQDDLRGLVETTISCDEGEAHKTDPHAHCGLCTSCLLRRAAILAVPGFADPTVYRDHPTRSHGQFELETFEYQANRLADLATWENLLAIDSSARFAIPYLQSAHPGRSVANLRAEVLRVLHQHGGEVRNFLKHAHPIVTTRPLRPPAIGGPRDLFSATR